MIVITPYLSLPESDIEFSAIRAQGAGGQNVNKVSSAIHLRFDIQRSALTPFYKERMLKMRDSRISKEGVLIIKAQQFRTQEKNREDAITRLKRIIREAGLVKPLRRPTKPTKASNRRRLDSKSKQSHTKRMRGKVTD